MQAHLLSSPAARSSTTSLLTSPSSTPKPEELALHSNAQALASHTESRSVSEYAGLAHDAGNLLGALQLYCGLLKSPGVLRSEHSHYANELSLISSRSSALIRRLLQQLPEQTILPSQPQPATFTNSDPADVLRNLAPVLHRIAEGSELTVSTPSSPLGVDLPAESLERITVNLVRNAAEALRKASHPWAGNGGPSIPAPRIEVILKVNGPGMPPSIAAAFLRPAPLPRGVIRGLGHLIIHELATASGGVLSIRVRPGRGTMFCIKWPLRKEFSAVKSESLELPAGSDIAC
jgi:signal transduction histidine kinase